MRIPKVFNIFRHRPSILTSEFTCITEDRMHDILVSYPCHILRFLGKFWEFSTADGHQETRFFDPVIRLLS